MGGLYVPAPPGSGISPPAGDLGGSSASPTVLTTHLSTPMPVSQGGTGAGTAAGAATSLAVIPSSAKGAANGVAPLDGAGSLSTVPLSDKGGQVFNVKAYGAAGNGTTDDTAAIQAALNAAGAGGVAYLPPGVYGTSSPLTLPPGAEMTGAAGADTKNWGDIGAVLKPLAGFTGSAVLSVTDTGSNTAGPRLRRIGIDGSASPASVAGLSVTGNVQEGYLEDLMISQVTGAGIVFASDASGVAHSWHVSRVKVDAAGGNGFTVSNVADTTWIDCFALGCTGHGFSIAGSCPNTRFIGCRSEWSGSTKFGYLLSGAWGTGSGSGGLLFSGCSTDRNDQDGWHISATGTTPVILSGCMARRDGRNGGSGGSGFAGLNINAATIPVIVTGFTCFPGVDDGGGATNSPQYGAAISNTPAYVALTNVFLHGNTAGLNYDSTGVLNTRAVAVRSGSTSAPGSITKNADIT